MIQFLELRMDISFKCSSLFHPVKKHKISISCLLKSIEPTRSENHDNERCSGFPKIKSKSVLFKVKQNNFTELLGIVIL